MQQIVEIGHFLVREPLFQGLTRDQYRWVAERCQMVSFPPGEVIISEDTEADAFYIIYSGKVHTLFTEDGEEEIVSILNPGEYFGDETLLFDYLEPYTVRTIDETRVLKIEEEEFYQIIDQFPQVEKRLKATTKSREAADRYAEDWLQPDEVIQFAVRRHPFFLFKSLIIPSIFLGISIAVALYFYSVNSLYFRWFFYFSILMVVFGILWLLWRSLDWRNDYFIVTSERVVHMEKVIGFYNSRVEAPLSSIIAVDVIRSLLGQILDFGDVSVRSYMGNLLMNGVNQPSIYAKFVNDYKNKVMKIDQEKNLEMVNKSLREGFERRSQEPTWDSIPIPEQTAKPRPTAKTFIQRDLVKSARTIGMMRWERDGIITYRRHWYSLIGKIWWQIVLILLISAVSSWLAANGFQVNIACSFSGFLILILFLMMVYRIWDWVNDIFQLTDTQIVDIDKKPLGAEGRKTASLDSPDFRIEHVRPSFIANLLNFGDVVVYIGQTPFNLNGVYNPDQVHQEVAMRRFSLIHKKRQDEDKRNQEKMLDWLTAYHDFVDENGEEYPPVEPESGTELEE